MMAGLTFPFYSEGRITFPPTYKYNNGTDLYDTSYVIPSEKRDWKITDLLLGRRLEFQHGVTESCGKGIIYISLNIMQHLYDSLTTVPYMRYSSALYAL